MTTPKNFSKPVTIIDILQQKYDHVLEYETSEIPLPERSRIDDMTTDKTVCVNRNLHNGATKNMEIKAKIEEDGKVYIAGNYT